MSLPFRTLTGLFVALLPVAAQGQGYTPYDTYRDAYGAPHYSGNLTPAPDDRALIGSQAAIGDPWLTRTRPARGWGEIADPNAGFWEWQADRIQQRQQDLEALDQLRLLKDADTRR